jgi:hypothetical protein
VQLNGAFKGQATGETFNFQGKTDILIRFEGKNVFIAECKFWKGRETVPTHTHFKRDLGASGESVFRYVFAQPKDSNREIILTVFAFDIPTQGAETDTT